MDVDVNAAQQAADMASSSSNTFLTFRTVSNASETNQANLCRQFITSKVSLLNDNREYGQRDSSNAQGNRNSWK
jgi:hypothetical protein